MGIRFRPLQPRRHKLRRPTKGYVCLRQLLEMLHFMWTRVNVQGLYVQTFIFIVTNTADEFHGSTRDGIKLFLQTGVSLPPVEPFSLLFTYPFQPALL